MRHQFGINRVNRIEILVEIKVLGLDIEDDGVVGMIIDQGAITLVPFGNKIFPLGIPSGIGSKNGDFGADVVGWLESASAQYMCRHRRSGRFSMHAANNDALAGGHHGGERIRPQGHGDSETHSLVESRVTGLDG